MEIASLVITILLAAMVLFSGIGKLRNDPACSEGCPRDRRRADEVLSTSGSV
jgi:hypothetical protein